MSSPPLTLQWVSSRWRFAQAPAAAAAVPLFALTLALLVSAASWPGFMSFDSVLALSQARHGITESGYPPMVSYVWWLTDHIIPGAGGMLLLQNLLVFFGLAKIAHESRTPAAVTIVAMTVLIVAPVTLGPMLVVWKDVAFAGWLALAAGFSLAYWRRGRSRDGWLALGLSVIACAYRLNALPGVVPVLAVLGDGLARRRDSEGMSARRLGVAAAATVAASIACMLVVVALSSYRLPDGRRLATPHGHHPWTMAGDLVGMSVCRGRSVLPDTLYPPGHAGDIAFLRTVYAPQHAQKTFATKVDGVSLAGSRIDQVHDLQSRWWDAVRADPACFLWHRWQVTRFLLGMNSGPVFYLTDIGVARNDMGLQFHPGVLTRWAVAWIHRAGDSVLARAGVFLLLAVAALGIGLARRREARFAVVLLASALLYLGLGALVLPAADARYQFWVVTACIAAVMLMVGAPERRHNVATLAAAA